VRRLSLSRIHATAVEPNPHRRHPDAREKFIGRALAGGKIPTIINDDIATVGNFREQVLKVDLRGLVEVTIEA
jgi:hypothetical protein